MKLRADSLFDLSYVRDAKLSPHGNAIAFVISHTTNEEHFDLWLADASGSNERKIAAEGDAKNPRWSPDGKKIAFVSNGQLRVLDVASQRISSPLTPSSAQVQGAPSWAPDGERVVMALLENDVAHGDKPITEKYFRAEGVGLTRGITQMLYELTITDGRLRCLTPDQGICSQPEWSPDGDAILFLATDAQIPYAAYSPALFLVDAASGSLSKLLSAPWYIASARWITGGNRIALAAAYDSQLTIPSLSLWTIDLNGGSPEERTRTSDGTIGCWNHHDMPIWEFMYGANAFAVLDQKTILTSAQRQGSVEIWKVGLEGPPSIERVVTGDRSCILLDAHGPADLLLFAVTDALTPTEIHSSKTAGQGERALTDLNGAAMRDWPSMKVLPLSFQTSDGQHIEAWFLRSAEVEEPLPTILFIHGGPFGSIGHIFRYDFHLLASHGFGVLFANFRGSAGYGEPFVRSIMGNWGANAYPDHIGAVDAAIATGLADPNRLGVWGPSHGGFATCWVVTHSDRFRAAVAEAVFTDFTTLYYLTDAPDVFARDLGGRPYEIPDVYRARSPLTYAHRCKTATLLIHGESDMRCPISEAEQFFRALQDAGCTTGLLRIPNCTHLGDSLGPLSARKLQNEGLLSWFSKYL